MKEAVFDENIRTGFVVSDDSCFNDRYFDIVQVGSKPELHIGIPRHDLIIHYDSQEGNDGHDIDDEDYDDYPDEPEES